MMTREQIRDAVNAALDWAPHYHQDGAIELTLKSLADHDAEQRQTIATLTEHVKTLEAELNEQWIDEKGTVWTRPTAWAYAQACRVMHENKERVRALEAERVRDVSECVQLTMRLCELEKELAQVKGAV